MIVETKLPKMSSGGDQTGCCPRFLPDEWDEKIFALDDFIFVKATTRSLMYMPINLGKVYTSTFEAIDNARAKSETTYLVLSKDISSFKCEHYFLVDAEVPSLKMNTLEGNYLTKVFEGPFKDMGKWMSVMKLYVKSNGYESNEIYSFYTTCPKCSKHYGKNYVVLFAKLNSKM